MRKEKEQKRDSYLSVLHKHELSAEHQDLMTSTRDIGQTLSAKQHLKKLLKRHKAGLPLTEAEEALLFPEPSKSEEELFAESGKSYEERVLLLQEPTLPTIAHLSSTTSTGGMYCHAYVEQYIVAWVF